MRLPSVCPVLALLPICLSTATAAPAPGDDADRAERQALEGTWVAVSSEVNGTKRGEKESKHQTITFRGERCTQADSETGDVLEGTYKLDLTGKHKLLATTLRVGQKEVTVRYIFERDGDRLKMCCHLLPGNEPPKEFSAPEGSKRALLVFKRLKE
jgi:uncharacterized protein (TIGR03067 family)